MNPWRSAWMLLIGCGALAAGAQAADYYVRKSGAAVYLSSSGGVSTPVLSVAIPSGTWVINAKVGLVNFGNADIARCNLAINGVVIDNTASMLGGADGMPVVAAVSLLAVKSTTTAASTVYLACGHDADVPGQRIDPGNATLVITRTLVPLP